MASITFGKSGTRPYCTLTVTIKSQSVANNTSTVSYKLVLHRPYSISSSATKTWSCTINGTKHSGSGTIGGSGDKTLLSGTQTITHNTDGTKKISYSGSCKLAITWSGVSLGTISGSGSMTLTTIPRYATVTQSLSSKTETSIKINWTSDSTIDYIWYSSNNGSTWTGVNVTDGTSGGYTISGLSANTTYKIKTRVRRKDSQLTTDSSALSVTTYQYPYVSAVGTSNLVIGGTQTLTLYNPLNRSVDVYMKQNSTSGTTLYSISDVTGDNISFTTTGTTATTLYASIPNAQSGTAVYYCVYSGQTVSTKTGTYSVSTTGAAPSISTATYRDSNSATIAITDDSGLIIRNKSTVVFDLNGLQAKYSASLSSVAVTVNGVTQTATVSGTVASKSISYGVIDSSSDVTATITLTDSRGLTGTKTVTITMLDWVAPSAIITLQRQQNYYSETDITVDGSVSSLNGNNTMTIQYQYKKVTDSSYGSLATLTDNVTATFTADNNYQWNVRVIVTDLLGSTTYNLTLDKGIPIVFFDRLLKSVGINCFPIEENSLEVNGVNVSKSVMTRSLSAALTNLEVSTYTIIPLDLSNVAGDKLTATNDGGVQIGANVSKVLVSGRVSIQGSATAGRRHLRIMKNSYTNNNTLAWSQDDFAASATEDIVITPTLADVEEGDIIYMWYYVPNSADALGGNAYGARTSLTVETVM